MNIRDRWAASRERNSAAVAERAERLMSDTRFDALRTRGARLVLVGAFLGSLALIPVSYLLLDSAVGLIAVFLCGLAWALLRVSVRVIADLPDEYLDERQLAVRNASYVESYRWLGSLVALALTLLMLTFTLYGSELRTWTLTLTWETVMSIFWVFLGLALALPSMVLAVNDTV